MARRTKKKEDGWALLFVLLMSAIFIITAAGAVTSAAFEVRRQREADLMYRGKDYKRAVQLYYRKFRKYPARMEDLENTNQLRFLRRRWKDPITGSDEWRLLHMSPVGLLTDSINTVGVAGATGLTASAGFGSTTGANSSTGTAGSNLTPTLAGSSTISGSIVSTSTTSNQGLSIGAGIAGVASKSEKASIMVYNTYQKYNQWEFVYDFRKDPMMAAAGGLNNQVAAFAQNQAQQNQLGGGLNQSASGFSNTPNQGGGFNNPAGGNGIGFSGAVGLGLNPPGSTVGVPVYPTTGSTSGGFKP